MHDKRLDGQQITVDIPPIKKRADLIRRSIVGSDRPGFQGGLEGVSGQATDVVGTPQDLLYSPRHPFFDKNCFVEPFYHTQFKFLIFFNIFPFKPRNIYIGLTNNPLRNHRNDETYLPVLKASIE